jgi:hypothetical protein
MQHQRPGFAVVKTPERGSLDVRAIRLGTREGAGQRSPRYFNSLTVNGNED